MLFYLNSRLGIGVAMSCLVNKIAKVFNLLHQRMALHLSVVYMLDDFFEAELSLEQVGVDLFCLTVSLMDLGYSFSYRSDHLVKEVQDGLP